ncbi:unnamed protein product [Orchesella dallaii]|uniref:Uncharacterized protein n=1 Tax=Orchesella dallaii TaxID=48710 RepID=A0ABP1RBC7_9HEXA
MNTLLLILIISSTSISVQGSEDVQNATEWIINKAEALEPILTPMNLTTAMQYLSQFYNTVSKSNHTDSIPKPAKAQAHLVNTGNTDRKSIDEDSIPKLPAYLSSADNAGPKSTETQASDSENSRNNLTYIQYYFILHVAAIYLFAGMW